MSYIVNFGPTTDSERYETMEDIEEWLDEYIENHLQYGEDFETEKQKFIENNIEEE